MLGGSSGALVGIGLLAVYLSSVGSTELLPQVFAVGLSLGLTGGALMGGAIGAIIYSIAARNGKDPDATVRVLIGVSSLLVYSLVVNLLSGGNRSFLFNLAYAIVVGVLPGLLARSKNGSEWSEAARHSQGRA
jgi:hypothetical protein